MIFVIFLFGGGLGYSVKYLKFVRSGKYQLGLIINNIYIDILCVEVNEKILNIYRLVYKIVFMLVDIKFIDLFYCCNYVFIQIIFYYRLIILCLLQIM